MPFPYLRLCTDLSQGGEFGIENTQDAEDNMLLSLLDIQRYTETLANSSPRNAFKLLFARRNDYSELFYRISEILNLPNVYNNCAKDWSLNGVSLGYFSLWPSGKIEQSLEEALTYANSLDSKLIVHDFAINNGLIFVAREESNFICVENNTSKNPDWVHYIDVTSSPTFEKINIAKDFEQFLILSANLHQISHSNSFNEDTGISAMTTILRKTDAPNESFEFWIDKVEELLAD